MKEWIAEVLCVIALSKRTQWAIILGVVSFVGINLLGNFMVSDLEFTGPLKGYQDLVVGKVLRRYDRVAWVSLISFWVLAFKFYRRDKKRLW